MSPPDPASFTRLQILDHAARLFAERGYHGLAMRELAQEVGVTKPTLYYHFQDKDALFVGVMRRATDDLGALVDAAAREEHTRARLGHFLRALADGRARHQAAMRLATHAGAALPADLRSEVNAAYVERFVLPLAQVMRRGTERGELRPLGPLTLAWALLGLAYPLVMNAAVVTPEEVLDLFLLGAAPRPDPGPRPVSEDFV